MAREITSFHAACLNEIDDWNIYRMNKKKCERTARVIQEAVFRQVTDYWHYRGIDSISYAARAYDLLEREFAIKTNSPWIRHWGELLSQAVAERYCSKNGEGFFELHENSPVIFASYATSRAIKFIRRALRAKSGDDRTKISGDEIRSEIDRLLMKKGSAKKICNFAERELQRALDRPLNDDSMTVEELYRLFDILWSLEEIGKNMARDLMNELKAFRNNDDGGYSETRKPGSVSLTCSTHFALNIMELILERYEDLKTDFDVKANLRKSSAFIIGSYLDNTAVGGGFKAPGNGSRGRKNDAPESLPNLIHTWLCLRTLEAIYDDYLENEKDNFLRPLKKKWADQILKCLQECYHQAEGGAGFGATPRSVPSVYATDCGLHIVSLLHRKSETNVEIDNPFPGFSAQTIYETLWNRQNPFNGKLIGWINLNKRVLCHPASPLQ